MKHKLTIIIPFCNEGDRLRRTIRNLTLTSNGMAQFIIVNDCSDDGFDYEDSLNDYKNSCILLRTAQPSGCCIARELGIAACQTPYFLLMDAHMGFLDRDNDWLVRVTKAIERYPDDLLSLSTMGLRMDGYAVNSPNHAASIGAEWKRAAPSHLLRIGWVQAPQALGRQCGRMPVNVSEAWRVNSREFNLVSAPIPLGAAYAASRRQWENLHGLRGLHGYGCDEQLLALKWWACGSRVLCVRNLAAAHMYHTADNGLYKMQYVRVVKMIFNPSQQKRLLARFYELNPEIKHEVENTDWSVQNTEYDYIRHILADGSDEYLEKIVNIITEKDNNNENSSK
jgi:glycosyltransferase involved in cell wall biosynthesis